jgi:fumarate reductase subunit D
VADPINFYLGVLGILFLIIYRKKYDLNYAWFFLFSIIFALPFLASIILLPKHFMFLEIFIIPAGAFAFNEACKKIKDFSQKDLTKTLLIIVLIISLIFLGLPRMNSMTHFYGKSAAAQVIDFKEEIPKISLSVGDSRIYRGQIHWMLYGRPYLEGTEFIQVLNQQESLPGEYVNVDVYYIECIKDDCGWGGIDKQQEFNATMESLTDSFKKQGKLVKTISEPDRFNMYYPFQEKNKIDTFNIYSAKIPMKAASLAPASQPKSWFLYNIGYFPIESNFDYYIIYNPLDKLLNTIARWIVLAALILAFLSPIYILYLIKQLNN